MNGAGAGSHYISEDDYDEFKPSPGHSTSFFNAASSSASVNTSSSSFNFSGVQASSSSQGSSKSQVCCLVDDGKRCSKFAGTASYNKRIQKIVQQKRLKLEIDRQACHIYICDHHKMVIQNARARQKKDSDDDINDGDDTPEVDLYQLQVNTLRRYKKHFKISSRPGLNKAQLADILTKHFKTIPVMEKETVTYFIYMIKSEKNQVENNNRNEAGATTSSDFSERF